MLKPRLAPELLRQLSGELRILLQLPPDGPCDHLKRLLVQLVRLQLHDSLQHSVRALDVLLELLPLVWRLCRLYGLLVLLDDGDLGVQRDVDDVAVAVLVLLLESFEGLEFLHALAQVVRVADALHHRRDLDFAPELGGCLPEQAIESHLVVGVHARGREGQPDHLEVGNLKGLEELVARLLLRLVGGIGILWIL